MLYDGCVEGTTMKLPELAVVLMISGLAILSVIWMAPSLLSLAPSYADSIAHGGIGAAPTGVSSRMCILSTGH